MQAPYTEVLNQPLVGTRLLKGVHGTHVGQDLAVMGWLRELGIEPLALGVTMDGHPKHPLYVPYSADLVPFTGR